MLTKAQALQLVSEKLLEMSSTSDPFVVVEAETLEKPFGWIFFYNSQRYLETGEFRYRLAGNGPVIVNKHNGTLEFLGTAETPDALIDEYERKLLLSNEVIKRCQ